jgi:hypothetical protein
MSKARELADVIGTQGTTEQVLSGRRNLIINGDFKVSQRGDYTSPTAVFYGYALDRWKLFNHNHIGVFQKTSVTINGVHSKALRVECTSSSGAGELTAFQLVEDDNVPDGAIVTASMYMRCNKPAGIRVNNGTSWSNVEVVCPPDGNWHRISYTFTAVNPPNNERVAIQAQIAEQFNTGDYYEFTQVQLELGSVATPFEHRSYGEELALCQRYYQHFVQMKANELHWTGTGGYYGGPVFPLVTTMRANPSIAKVANGTYSTSIGSTTQSSHQNMTVSATQDYASFHNNVTGNTIYGCQIAVRLDAEL